MWTSFVLQLFVVLVYNSQNVVYGKNLSPRLGNQVANLQENNCGASHNTQNGAIYHKPTAQILDNERCAWVIGVKGAVGYTIDIQYLGNPTNQPGSTQELSVTGIRHEYRASPTLTTYIPTSTGVFTVSDSNIVVVTFHSTIVGNLPSTGFVLRYESIQIGNISKIADESTHHFLSSPTLPFSYPISNERYYAYNELAAFLAPPGTKCFNKKPNHVLLQDIQTYNCYDPIYVFRFNINMPVDTGKWEQVGKICPPTNTQQISHDDIILLLFQSDNVSNGYGFRVSFMGC